MDLSMDGTSSAQRSSIVRVIQDGQDWEHLFLNDALYLDLDDFPIFTDQSTKKQYEIVFVSMNKTGSKFKVFALMPPVGEYYEIELKRDRVALFEHITWEKCTLRGDAKIEGVLKFHDSAKNGGLNQLIEARFIHVSSAPQVILFLFLPIMFPLLLFYHFFFHLSHQPVWNVNVVDIALVDFIAFGITNSSKCTRRVLSVGTGYIVIEREGRKSILVIFS